MTMNVHVEGPGGFQRKVIVNHITGLTSSSTSTKSPIITSIPPSPLVIASHPLNPNGVGVAIPSMMTFRSFLGMSL
jgi:hypothetical protein